MNNDLAVLPSHDNRERVRVLDKGKVVHEYIMQVKAEYVTNFIWLYLHQFFIDSHSLNGYGKPLKRPFDRY